MAPLWWPRCSPSVGRSDVPIGIGLGNPDDFDLWPQAEWLAEYDLGSYAGAVERDGVEAMIRTIMDTPGQIDIIAIGPLTNLAAAISREPRILEKTRIVAMQGSIRRGYGGRRNPGRRIQRPPRCGRPPRPSSPPLGPSQSPLWIPAVWLCSKARSIGALRDCADPLTRAVIDNYRLWCEPRGHARAQAEGEESSVLYDTVAVTMAFNEKQLVMEPLKLVVTEDGRTVMDGRGKEVRCATEWKDLPAFEDFLVQRLTTG